MLEEVNLAHLLGPLSLGDDKGGSASDGEAAHRGRSSSLASNSSSSGLAAVVGVTVSKWKKSHLRVSESSDEERVSDPEGRTPSPVISPENPRPRRAASASDKSLQQNNDDAVSRTRHARSTAAVQRPPPHRQGSASQVKKDILASPSDVESDLKAMKATLMQVSCLLHHQPSYPFPLSPLWLLPH